MDKHTLDAADKFEVRIVWERDSALLVGACALAGGLVGGYAGGRLGAAVGAGLGSVTGFGVAKIVSLREVWNIVREKLNKLLYVVFKFLRRVDPVDYLHALEIVIASRAKLRDLVFLMLKIIATNLGKEVISNMTTA